MKIDRYKSELAKDILEVCKMYKSGYMINHKEYYPPRVEAKMIYGKDVLDFFDFNEMLVEAILNNVIKLNVEE